MLFARMATWPSKEGGASTLAWNVGAPNERGQDAADGAIVCS